MAGRIALEQVHEGAKLDHGIALLSLLLDEVGEHVRAGHALSDEQLAAIADEADAIYREAIRAPAGDDDLGDFTSPGRDGRLDLDAATHVSSVQAQLADPEPAPDVIECSPPAAA